MITTQNLIDQFRLALQDLLIGATADLEAYAESLALDALRAVETNNPEILAHVKAQAGLLVEIHRLRLNKVGMKTLRNIVSAIIGIAINALHETTDEDEDDAN